jgi:hypothetical protein
MGFSLDYFVGADGAHVLNVGTSTTGQFGVEKFRVANLAVTCAVPLNVSSSISSTVQISTPIYYAMELLIWGHKCLKIMYGIHQMEIQKDYVAVI